MKKIRSLVVALAAIALVCAVTTTVKAEAADNNPCPPSPHGPGDILQSRDYSINVLVNSSIKNIVVLKDNMTADIVCTSPSTGTTTINDDRSVDFDAVGVSDLVGTVGRTNFLVGAVQSDQYITTSVSVNVIAVQLAQPEVIRKAKLKNGKVVRPAIVRFTNPTADYPIGVLAGDAGQPRPDENRRLLPGGATEIKTMRLELTFLQVIVENGTTVLNSAGLIDTVTGVVQMENLWNVGPDAGEMRIGAQALAMRWNATVS